MCPKEFHSGSKYKQESNHCEHFYLKVI